MQFVFPLIAIAILGVVEMSIISDHSKKLDTAPTPAAEKERTEEKEKINPTSPSNSDQNTNSSIKIIITQTPQKPTQTTQTNNNSALYPNAKAIVTSGAETRFESSDSPDDITNWYKEYIKNEGMNTTSFVTTNTNNNVLNKLAGAGHGKQIEVEIERKAGETVTKIKISLKSS